MFDLRHVLAIPYQRGGTDPQTGLDCLGLVRYLRQALSLPTPSAWSSDALRHFAGGVEIHRQLPNWQQTVTPSDGDLVIMREDTNRYWHHVGMFLGPDSVIHACEQARRVMLTPITRLGEQYAEWRYLCLPE